MQIEFRTIRAWCVSCRRNEDMSGAAAGNRVLRWACPCGAIGDIVPDGVGLRLEPKA